MYDKSKYSFSSFCTLIPYKLWCSHKPKIQFQNKQGTWTWYSVCLMNIFDVFLASNIWDIDKFPIIMSINFILITNDKTYKGLTVKITSVKRSKINYWKHQIVFVFNLENLSNFYRFLSFLTFKMSMPRVNIFCTTNPSILFLDFAH